MSSDVKEFVIRMSDEELEKLRKASIKANLTPRMIIERELKKFDLTPVKQNPKEDFIVRQVMVYPTELEMKKIKAYVKARQISINQFMLEVIHKIIK